MYCTLGADHVQNKRDVRQLGVNRREIGSIHVFASRSEPPADPISRSSALGFQRSP